MTTFSHRPVLLDEVLSVLRPDSGQVFLDGTLGGGGHAEAILGRLGPTGRYLGIDRDPRAIAAATDRLQGFPGFTALHGNFHDMMALVPEGLRFDGILLDLGVSSPQLDAAERGFSYHDEAALDMRMDPTRGITAADYLNTVSREDFLKDLVRYADEKWAARLADMLLEHRAQKPLSTTGDLVRLVDSAIPKPVRRRMDGHPARRVFQAVRIAVNDEIDPLEKALNDAFSLLKPGGRLAVISFHSVEDRIVKQCFQRLRNPCTCPPRAPVCVCRLKPMADLVKGCPMVAGDEELAQNPRARSAKLRAVTKR